MLTKKKMNIADERMLQVMHWAVSNGKARSEAYFAQSIGLRKQNMHNVKTGYQAFTKDHVLAAAKVYGINLNWLFGLESQMMRKPGKAALDRLKEIVAELEAEKPKSKAKAK